MTYIEEENLKLCKDIISEAKICAGLLGDRDVSFIGIPAPEVTKKEGKKEDE